MIISGKDVLKPHQILTKGLSALKRVAGGWVDVAAGAPVASETASSDLNSTDGYYKSALEEKLSQKSIVSSI